MILKKTVLCFDRVKRFIKVDLCVEKRESSATLWLLRRVVKFCALVVSEFTEGRCLLKASALTFISIVALIPLMAFVLSVSKGLGAEKVLDQKINTNIFNLPGGEVVSAFISFKQGLFQQIDNLDFSEPAAREEILSAIEAFEGFILSSVGKILSTKPYTSGDTFNDNTHDASYEQISAAKEEEAETAIKKYKEELAHIIASVDFSSEKAKNELKERIESSVLSIPSNISLNAFLYKKQIMHFVDRTSFSYLGAIGLTFLLFFVINTIGNIETSFNDIWKIKKSRSAFRKFTDYTSIMFVFPILILTSTTITAVLTNEKLVTLLNKIGIGKIYLSTLGLFLPIVALWVAFIFVYIFLPNTRVRVIPGIIGGMIGGTLFYILQVFYFKSQIGLARYNLIYGAFAAIPFFLLWLQMSWNVVLFGAVISYVIQNIRYIELKSQPIEINYASRELLGLFIMERISSQFLYGKGERWSTEGLSGALSIPIETVREIISELSKASLIVEIPTEKYLYYMPGKDLDAIHLAEVLFAMRNFGEKYMPVSLSPLDQKMVKLLDDLQDAIKHHMRFTMKDIIQDARAQNMVTCNQ
ncbi:MAG: YihY/virulence factor BrkB family protein [Candidatus Kuenenia sp.]|nr:YihY/virulence factor BrkB family protein [Candidatus Kuenenia sp.]